MTEKRYRTERIEGASLPFIVDNYSAKKHKTMTGYKAYDTNTVKKCDELTDLLNELQDKSDKKQAHIVILENKIHRMREAIHKLEWLATHRNGELMRENEQLKEEIAKFKEWEKHIGGVKREDLDRVFKMSIYEITEAFEYYRKRIKELEE